MFHRIKTTLLVFFFSLSACSPLTPIQNSLENASEPASTSSTANNPLTISVIDVGQGDSTLIRGPSGKTILIDAGREGEGMAAVLPTLKASGVGKLDWIITTHYDADHIGGLPEVLAGPDGQLGTKDDFLPTSGLFDRGDFTDKSTTTYRNYLEVTAPFRTQATPGQKIELGNGASAQVLVVNGSFSNGGSIFLNPDEENEACIGLLIRYGDFSYFTAGDLTGGGSPGGYETKDLETTVGQIIGDIDILHVGHHGSLSSTNQTFLDEITPEVAVISVGRDNDYGHPSPRVINRLVSKGIDIRRTDREGTISITSEGKGFQILNK